MSEDSDLSESSDNEEQLAFFQEWNYNGKGRLFKNHNNMTEKYKNIFSKKVQSTAVNSKQNVSNKQLEK